MKKRRKVNWRKKKKDKMESLQKVATPTGVIL